MVSMRPTENVLYKINVRWQIPSGQISSCILELVLPKHNHKKRKKRKHEGQDSANTQQIANSFNSQLRITTENNNNNNNKIKVG